VLNSSSVKALTTTFRDFWRVIRKLADDMDKIDESILTTYQAKTGLEPEKIMEMVNAET